MADRRNLNIGSSSVHLDGFVNMEYDKAYWDKAEEHASLLQWGTRINDRATRNKPDDFGDALCLHYADNTFDLVRSSHVMEHLPSTKIHRALSEQYRVLRPGGWVRVIVPALDILIHRWVNKERYEAFWDKTKSDPGLYKESERGVPFDSADEALISIIHLNGHHTNSFTERSLTDILTRVGFVDVQRCDAEEDGIPDGTCMDYSLRLKGQKPKIDPSRVFAYGLR